MKLTGSQILIEVLCEQGVDTVFGYPGGTVINIYDELYKSSDRITHYITCHEQAAAHAADGYARATGKTGVVIATSGPGATNLVTGIATAYLDSTPLVAITGNVACPMIGKDSFQEVDIIGVTIPVTKHNYIVKDITKLADTLRQAFLLAKSGRPGPVLVDIPKDIQSSYCEFDKKNYVDHYTDTAFNEASFNDSVNLMRTSKKPYIYIGGGVIISQTSSEIIELSKSLKAPIGSSLMAMSAIPSNYPLFLGMVGMHGKYEATKVLAESDLIIAVGTRFSDRATGNKVAFAKNKNIIHIDIDNSEIGKNIPAHVELVGNTKEILNKLISLNIQRNDDGWLDEIEDHKKQGRRCIDHDDNKLTPKYVIEKIGEKAKEYCLVATDVGQHQMWAAQFFPFMKPRTFITSGGLGTMGFGMGASIGSCIGKNKQRTVLFTSDGSFHMNLNEMATAVTNSLPLVIVLLNNNALGMVRQWQAMFFDNRYSNTELNRKTDYVKLAEAFGAKAVRVDETDELTSALDFAFKQDGPVLIDIHIDKDEKVLPMIPPGGTIDNVILN